MLRVSGHDEMGSVVICEKDVFRIVPNEFRRDVCEVLELVNNHVEGIIDTHIFDDTAPFDVASQGVFLLVHRKIPFISYPHEWCAAMLRDASLFHLSLSEKLMVRGLALKDAHPWNILFEQGHPIFVDFTSIVTEQRLFNEEYLLSNQKFFGGSYSRRVRFLVREIFSRMFQPYFLNPLLFYISGDRAEVRRRIEETTLNTTVDVIRKRECIPKIGNDRLFFRKIFQLAVAWCSEKFVYTKLLYAACAIEDFYSAMRLHILKLPVSARSSAYTSYYVQKGEDHVLTLSDEWNFKQINVFHALNSSEIQTVLDVACNTGWFALMAERNGKNVVAFDIDEGCIELLYKTVKASRLNVLPLVMDFRQLTTDKRSIHDGNTVLISASQRFRSDAVLVLGIIHHLVLGQGMRFEDILDPLVELCKHRLIIEFVEPDDLMITTEPSFFPAYFKDPGIIAQYDLNTLTSLIEERGFEVKIVTSYPDTRKILVCEKK